MTIAAASFATPEAQVLCAHCNLPVPAGLVDAAAEHQFCCHGCQSVFTIIHSCKLDRYYAFRDRDLADAGLAAEPAHTTGKAYREFDDPTFLNLHAPVLANSDNGIQKSELRRTAFYLEGTHCAACVWLVEKLPALLPGVREARLNLGQSLLTVTWDHGVTPLSKIARMLDSLGYPPHPARSHSARAVRKLDDRRQLIRIGVAGACTGNTMLLAVALYAGLFSAMDPAYTLLFRWLSMVIGLIALVWPGSVFFRGAMAALRTRTPHLDLPIALGLGAGGIAGLINTVTNSGEIYFDSLAVLVFLLLVGRFLQHRQQALADDSVELLFSLTPMTAHRVTSGEEGTEDVPITALQLQDVVEVMAGESIPVDGVVAAGTSALDESLLTGESVARGVGVGQNVHAGTVNLASPIRVSVHATGEATRVGKLMRLVTECARAKAPIVLFADRLAGRFLVGVLGIAAAVFVGWHFFTAAGGGADHAVAILIIACPCALGLATPLAVSVAIGRAARRGILIKGGETLERLAKPGVLLLDKTGTLTMGRAALVWWVGDESVRGLVAQVEAQATHPIARALVEGLRGNLEFGVQNSALKVTQHRQGIVGEVSRPGGGLQRIAIGSRAFLEGQGVTIPAWGEAEVGRALESCLTPVLIAVDDRLCAVAACGDALRPDARAVVEELRALGWRVGILSGDHPAIVRQIAGQLDIPPTEARGGLLPEEKLAVVRAELLKGPVVMVGDGVNDAAALAAATVGIAVHGGAEASLAAANIYLHRPGLRAILEVMQASRSTLGTIRRALVASLTYNAFSVTLAAVGLINPLVAAILMPVSSLTVLSLAFGAKTFRTRGDGLPQVAARVEVVS